jgi:DNA-binding NarL/FixJ family response regulator
LCLPSNLIADALTSLFETALPECRVSHAADTDQAFAMLSSQGPFNLAVLCAGSAGALVGTIRRLRSAQPGLAVAVLVDELDQTYLNVALQEGVAGILPAATPSGTATAILELLAHGGRYIPPLHAPAGEAPRGPNSRQSPPNNDAARAGRQPLSPRQMEVLQLLSHGDSNKTIARALRMGENTVKTHIKQIMRRLNARNRTEAALLAARLGLAAPAVHVTEARPAFAHA